MTKEKSRAERRSKVVDHTPARVVKTDTRETESAILGEASRGGSSRKLTRIALKLIEHCDVIISQALD